jgi:hypothetical protein
MVTAQVNGLSPSPGPIVRATWSAEKRRVRTGQEAAAYSEQVQRWDKKLDSGIESLPRDFSHPQGFETGNDVATTAFGEIHLQLIEQSPYTAKHRLSTDCLSAVITGCLP